MYQKNIRKMAIYYVINILENRRGIKTIDIFI